MRSKIMPFKENQISFQAGFGLIRTYLRICAVLTWIRLVGGISESRLFKSSRHTPCAVHSSFYRRIPHIQSLMADR